jgi:hypothetical protein
MHANSSGFIENDAHKPDKQSGQSAFPLAYRFNFQLFAQQMTAFERQA